MEEVLQKIKDLRNVKGFSHENMANKLKISTSAYRKIESNETKLTVERLLQIAKVLQTPVDKFLGTKQSTTFYQNNNDSGPGTIIGNQDIENYYQQENRKTTQKLIQTMEREMAHLREEFVFLREMVKK